MRILVTTFCLLSACKRPTEPPPPTPTNDVAIEIVYEGSWGWLGNELYVRSMDDWRYGAYQHLRVAIEVAASELPPGAQLGIVANDLLSGRIAFPIAPARPGLSTTVGPQAMYEPNIRPDLPSGIQMGLDELARTNARRKLLVVIGSGSVVNNDEAPAALGALRAAAERAQISTAAIVLTMEWGELKFARAWTDTVIEAQDSWQIVEKLREIARDTRNATASR